MSSTIIMTMSIKIMFLNLAHQLTNLIAIISQGGWVNVHILLLVRSYFLDLIRFKPIIRFCWFGEDFIADCVYCITDWVVSRVGKWGCKLEVSSAYSLMPFFLVRCMYTTIPRYQKWIWGKFQVSC